MRIGNRRPKRRRMLPRGQRPEAGDQRKEDRGQTTEDGGQRPEAGDQRTEAGRPTHQVGQGDHHEGVPGPDVQVVGLHGKLQRSRSRLASGLGLANGWGHRGGSDLSVGGGGHGELHVAVGDVRLAVVEAAAAEELLAHGRKSSVAAYDQLGLDLLHRAVGPVETPEVTEETARRRGYATVPGSC